MKSKLLSLLVTIMLIVGCGDNSFKSTILSKAKEKGWSEKQRKAALADSYTYFLRNAEVDTDIDKNNDLLAEVDTRSTVALPFVRYNLLSLDEVLAKLDQWLGDFDIILGYELSEEARFVDFFGLRPSLTRDETVMQAIRARVKAVQLDLKFKTLLGKVPPELTATHHMDGYNLRRILGVKNPLDHFKFDSDNIDQARSSGVLKLIERGKSQISHAFDRKERDPSNPEDSNAFVWVSSAQELEVASYKILYNDRPENNFGDYIEAFRWTGGKREVRPCLKIFGIGNDPRKTIFVIYPKREGDPGFGLPEFVEETYQAVGVNDILRDQTLIDRLFDDKKKHNRVPPKIAKLFVEVAKFENPIDIWETTSDRDKGFSVPFKYNNALGSNYNVRVEMSLPSADSATSESFFSPRVRSVRYFKKEWTNGKRFEAVPGEVVEYYSPRAPYNQLKLMSARVLAEEDTKKIILTKEDGSTEEGFVNPGNNKFVEDTPSAIFYTDGERRYVIKKSVGSRVFDKRRELSTTMVEKTGVYENQF